MQTDPGPIPHLTMSAPFKISSCVWSAVQTFPAIITIFEYLFLKSLIKLFSYYDLTVTDVERGSRYGGNIRVHVTKGKDKPISENVSLLLKLEEESVYKAF